MTKNKWESLQDKLGCRAPRRDLEGQPPRSLCRLLCWVAVPHTHRCYLPQVEHSYPYSTSLGSALTQSSNYQWPMPSSPPAAVRTQCALPWGTMRKTRVLDRHWVMWLQSRGHFPPAQQQCHTPTGDPLAPSSWFPENLPCLAEKSAGYTQAGPVVRFFLKFLLESWTGTVKQRENLTVIQLQ